MSTSTTSNHAERMRYRPRRRHRRLRGLVLAVAVCTFAAGCTTQYGARPAQSQPGDARTGHAAAPIPSRAVTNVLLKSTPRIRRVSTSDSYTPSTVIAAHSEEEIQRLGMPLPENRVHVSRRVVTLDGQLAEDSRRAVMTIDANHSSIHVLPRVGGKIGQFAWARGSGTGTFYLPRDLSQATIVVTGNHNTINISPEVLKYASVDDLGTGNSVARTATSR